MVAEAERLLAAQGHHAAMLASHELGNAIHAIARRSGDSGSAAPSCGTGCVDVQARIPEEMSVYTARSGTSTAIAAKA